jgi:hypothetical protein
MVFEMVLMATDSVGTGVAETEPSNKQAMMLRIRVRNAAIV